MRVLAQRDAKILVPPQKNLQRIPHVGRLLAEPRFAVRAQNRWGFAMREHEIPDLSISDEKLCFIIAKAREFDVKDVVTNPDDASNPTDDAMLAVLEDHKDDPVMQELVALIDSMSVDEQVDLVALTWLGRGDGDIEDWADLRADAASAHNRRTAAYLLGIPLLADYLDDAIDQFGID
jgi:hypothetical protein